MVQIVLETLNSAFGLVATTIALLILWREGRNRDRDEERRNRSRDAGDKPGSIRQRDSDAA